MRKLNQQEMNTVSGGLILELLSPLFVLVPMASGTYTGYYQYDDAMINVGYPTLADSASGAVASGVVNGGASGVLLGAGVGGLLGSVSAYGGNKLGQYLQTQYPIKRR